MDSDHLARLSEADRRGILPENMRPAFEEAVRRGLIKRHVEAKPLNPRAEAVKSATRNIPVLGSVVGYAADQIAAIPGDTDRPDVRGIDVNKDFAGSETGEVFRKAVQFSGPIGTAVAPFIPTNGSQARLRAAQATTIDDRTFGNVLEREFGDRFIGYDQDRYGQKIIRFKGEDGSVQERFANQPGLDAGDIERSVAFSAPFLATGGMVGGALKGAGQVARTLGQGFAGSSASAGQDVGANLLGAEQGFSPERAVVSGVGGAVGEQLVARIGSWVQARSGNRRIFTEDGNLTPGLERRVRKEGLDDEGVEQLKTLLRDNKELNNVADPMEAFRKARAEKEGMQLSKGQRTRDINQLHIEEEMSQAAVNGTPEEAAKATAFRTFKTETQPLQVRRATERVGTDLRGGRTMRDPRNPNELGSEIGAGVQSARETLKAEERAAWKPVENFTATEAELGGLPMRLDEGLGDLVNALGTTETPAANAAAQSLRGFLTGDMKAAPQSFSGVPRRTSIPSMLRQISQFERGAITPTDKTAMKGLRRGYEKWLDDMVDAAQAPGADPTRAAQIFSMREARSKSAAIKSLTSPKNRGDVAGRRLKEIFDGPELTAEELLDKIVGNVDSARAKPQTAQMLLRLKDATKRGGSPEVFDDIRTAYWTRLVTPAKPTLDTYGKIGLKNPNMIRKSIRSAMKNQQSVMRALFSAKEIRRMNNFASIAEDLTTAAIDGTGSLNPSGTSFSIARMGKMFAHTWLGMMESRANFSVLSGENVGLRKAKAAAIGGIKNAPIFRDVASGAGGGLRSDASRAALSQTLQGRIRPSSRGSGAAASSTEDTPGGAMLRNLGKRAKSLTR